MGFEVKNQPTKNLRYHGPLHILSDVTPLAASASSTSDWVRGDNLSKLLGAAYSDQAGTLKIQFSADGTNVDHEETITVAAGQATGGFVVDVILPFFRLVYANGATLQTVFRCNLFGRGVS
jgi:hypothetical protein